MTPAAAEARLELAAEPRHRVHEQLRFLRSFPAYTAEGTENRLTLWYASGRTASRLTLAGVDGGVLVEGDRALARRVLNADAPPLPPEDALPAQPPAHRILYRRYAGIRPVLFPAFFEGMAWTILGQQITVNLAIRFKNSLAQRYGVQVDGGAGPIWVFPGPAALAGASVEELKSQQLSRQKAEALLAVARAIDSGAWDPEAACRQPSAEAASDLRRFRGVGRWTAEYILLRVAGHPDVLPAGDAGLQRAWARLNGAAGRADDRALQEAGAAWSGWRSDFAFYLWLDNFAERLRAASPAGAGSRPAEGAPPGRG